MNCLLQTADLLMSLGYYFLFSTLILLFFVIVKDFGLDNCLQYMIMCRYVDPMMIIQMNLFNDFFVMKFPHSNFVASFCILIFIPDASVW
jgi:hypothetical protein